MNNSTSNLLFLLQRLDHHAGSHDSFETVALVNLWQRKMHGLPPLQGPGLHQSTQFQHALEYSIPVSDRAHSQNVACHHNTQLHLNQKSQILQFNILSRNRSYWFGVRTSPLPQSVALISQNFRNLPIKLTYFILHVTSISI